MTKIEKERKTKRDPTQSDIDEIKKIIDKSTIIPSTEFMTMDIETTGFDREKCDIIQFAVYSYDFSLSFNFKPESSIPEFITNINNITNDDVKNSPKFDSFSNTIKIVESVLNSHNAYTRCICVYNRKFDIRFLNHKMKSNKEFHCGFDEKKILDPMFFALKRHPEIKCNLKNMLKMYSVPFDERNLHGALFDAKYLYDLIINMQLAETIPINNDDYISFDLATFIHNEYEKTKKQKKETDKQIKELKK